MGMKQLLPICMLDKKLCSEPDCNSYGISPHGKCRSHGPRCMEEGCMLAQYARGFCNNHDPKKKEQNALAIANTSTQPEQAKSTNNTPLPQTIRSAIISPNVKDPTIKRRLPEKSKTIDRVTSNQLYFRRIRKYKKKVKKDTNESEKKSTELLRAVSSGSGEDDKPTNNASKVKQKTKNGKKPNWHKLRKKGHGAIDESVIAAAQEQSKKVAERNEKKKKKKKATDTPQPTTKPKKKKKKKRPRDVEQVKKKRLEHEEDIVQGFDPPTLGDMYYQGYLSGINDERVEMRNKKRKHGNMKPSRNDANMVQGVANQIIANEIAEEKNKKFPGEQVEKNSNKKRKRSGSGQHKRWSE